MDDVRRKYVLPTVEQTSFNCPHCGTLAKQFWYQCYADPMKADAIPHIWQQEEASTADFSQLGDLERIEALTIFVKKCALARPFLDKSDTGTNLQVINLHISKCYDCGDLALWLHSKLFWPTSHEAPLPNPDLPADVRSDYEEAGTILNASPRGSAALLRLAVQKLCKHLGEKGKNIDDDIASLVKKGLDVRVQQALDIVRVVGNNAVHPGVMDLKDDRTTAEKMFGLLNIIADIMISQPKHIQSMFKDLPPGAIDGIQKRDSKGN